MEDNSIERIRSATFTIARHGYDKREVERFLHKLADWLEAGGEDEARADLVKRELERVGQRPADILATPGQSPRRCASRRKRRPRRPSTALALTLPALARPPTTTRIRRASPPTSTAQTRRATPHQTRAATHARRRTKPSDAARRRDARLIPRLARLRVEAR